MKHRPILLMVFAGAILTHGVSAEENAVPVAVGRVAVVRSQHAISTVIVGDPTIADVVAEGDHAVLVFGKKSGRTDLVLMDGNHRLLRKSAIVVGPTGGEDTIIVRRPDKDGIVEDAWVCIPICTKVKDK